MNKANVCLPLFSLACGLAAANPVAPEIADAATPYVLNHAEMSGGVVDERILRLVNGHYMAIDPDARWVNHFASRDTSPAFMINEGFKQRYEGFGKFIDAGALFSRYTQDPAVAARTTHLVDALRATRDPDGYIGFWKAEPDDRQLYMNWTIHEQEYILLAQLRCYLEMGNEQALEDAKVMADYLLRHFPTEENGLEGRVYKDANGNDLAMSARYISTAGLPEAFLTIYRITGDRKYLDFAANTKHGNGATEVQFASLRTWNQDITPFGAGKERCHVYVMTARNYAQTELYRETGETNLLTMTRRELHELFRRDMGAMLITGSTSEGEFFTYNQNGAGHIEESCVTAYLMRWLDSLMRLEGDFRYGDVLERTMYNALFAANSPDGRHIRYFTNFSGPREYDAWHDGFCCCGNFRRAVAELPRKIVYATADGRVAVNFFTPFEKTFGVGDAKLALRCTTDYPNSGRVRFEILADSAVPLAFRVPRWCTGAMYAVNDEGMRPAARDEKGLCTIRRAWKKGDTVVVGFPMPWRLVIGREAQAGRVALMRGPMLFCLGARLNPGITDFRSLRVDFSTLGDARSEDYFRTGGQTVTAQAYAGGSKDPITVTFSEFADDTGREVYFLPASPRGAAALPLVADEIIEPLSE